MIRAPLLLALAGVLLAGACRRSPAEEPTTSPPLALPVESDDPATRSRLPAGSGSRVLWLGLDGLDWELLDRLSAQGKMPNWKRLVSEGYSARLEAFEPLISPLLWTSAATGVTPEAHGVLDFQEVDPATGWKVPISGWSRRVPALWNLSSAAGREVVVVGWWATHPAEEVNGFFVSDHAVPLLSPELPRAGIAFPPALGAGVERVIEREAKISGADVAAFGELPIEQVNASLASGEGMQNRIVALSRILSATRVSQRIARDLYDRHRPDLLMLYLQGTDEIGHVFGAFLPPKLLCVSDADFSAFGRVVDNYYALVDRLLGQWLRRAEEDGATLLVHSDHGFRWGADRPCELASGGWKTASFWHRREGALAAWGARVRPSSVRGRAKLLDVAPTVAALLDFPMDRRMEGRPLRQAFQALAMPRRESLFDRISVRRVTVRQSSPEQASEYAKKLRALGYISGSEPEALAATGGDEPGWTEAAWNNLGVYRREESGNLEGAAAAFRRALELNPRYSTALLNLAVLHARRGEHRTADELLLRALGAGYPDPAGTALRWALEHLKAGRLAAARALLARAAQRFPDDEPLAQQLAYLRFQSGNCHGAHEALSRFAGSQSPDTLNSLALYMTCLGRKREAIALLERSLLIRPDQPQVRDSLARVRASAAEERRMR